MIRLRESNEYRKDYKENNIRSYNLIDRANIYIRNYIKSVVIQ